MKVLIACEESQRVCIAFRKRGHEAYSCDIQSCSGEHLEWHIQDDVLNILNGNCIVKTMDEKVRFIDKWDLIIAHPPCTYLSRVGSRWLYPNGKLNEDRYKKGVEAREFFMKFYNNTNCEHIAIENPTPFKIFNLPPCSQAIQPYEYGEPYTKRTCLWLKNLPALKPTQIIPKEQRITTDNADWFQKGSKKQRAINRSKTFIGIAEAMASQWGRTKQMFR